MKTVITIYIYNYVYNVQWCSGIIAVRRAHKTAKRTKGYICGKQVTPLLLTDYRSIFVRKKSYKYSWRVKEAIKPIQSVHNHNAHANCLIHHHPLKRQRSRHPSGVRLRLSLGCLVDPHFLAAQDHPVRICRPNFKQSIFPSFPRGALALVLTIFTMHCT